MRGRTGTPQRRNDPTPFYLLLAALTLAGKLLLFLPFFTRIRRRLILPSSCSKYYFYLPKTDFLFLE